MKIKDLLKEELKRSSDYQREHFGAYIGDGFEDLVREIGRSNTGFNLLQRGFVASLEGIVTAKVDGSHIDNGDDAEKFVVQNLDLFKPQLNMLYWGIQIGKRLAKEQVEMDKVTEKLVAEATQTAEVVSSEICPVCQKQFEKDHVRCGPAHLCCADPALANHKRMWKPTGDGSADVIGYFDDMGLAHWADGTTQAVN